MKLGSIITLLLFSITLHGQNFRMEDLTYTIEIDSSCIKNIHNNGDWIDSVFSKNIDTLLNLFLMPDGLKLSDIINMEEKVNSKNISPDYFIDIGEGIYPNKKDYVLSKSIIFERFECPYFQVEVNYYSTVDSIIKVVMFEWNEFIENRDITTDPAKKNDIFQTRFYKIENKMSSKLGKFKRKSIPRQRKKKTYRSDIKWKSEDGLNAYLFMFSNNNNNYRQIRLAIYKD